MIACRGELPEPCSDAAPVVAPAATSASTNDRIVVELKQQLGRMAAITELIAQIESVDDIRSACQIVADQLPGFLSAELVLVGWCRERSVECRLMAITGVSAFHASSELAVAAQAALQECVARGELSHWPASDESRSGGLLAHRRFAQIAGAEAVVTAPLRDAQGNLRGAWIVTGRADVLHGDRVPSFLQAAAAPIASAIRVVKRGQAGPLQRMVQEIHRWLGEQRGRTLLIVFALIAFLACLPLHYHPRGNCTIEPVTRRYVAAPFQGALEKTFVEPGDVVKKGQLLARLDGREVRMELSGSRADLHRAAKQRAGHLATHESGEAEVARFEVDRLQARTDLLEHREKNVEIRSPIEGIVVSGDLEDAEGTPLDVGQTLFEIAPLDEMVVEIGIAEDDFAYVRPGMPVSVRLNAFPLRHFQGSIQRIHPRAILRDEENVFVAEVRLANPGLALRPGMRGTGRVESDRYPLGWNLFRRPLSAAIAWLGW